MLKHTEPISIFTNILPFTDDKNISTTIFDFAKVGGLTKNRLNKKQSTMKKNQFINVTEKEQKLFENLSGQKDNVLLLYVNELTEDGEDFLEYYFTYSDTTAEKFGLETFYAKIKKADKKKELVTKAISRLTEKMVKRNVVEIEEEPEFDLQSVGNANDSDSDEEHSTYSQEHYKLSNNGSFAAICKKADYYYILTAHHCIEDNQNLNHCSSDNKENYRLVNDSTCKKVNEEMFKNGLDAGLYRIDYREDFTKTNLFINRFSLTGYTAEKNTKNKMCFHDSDSITFKEYNEDCGLVYYNNFYINEGLILGNSGGLAHLDHMLTGIISGYDDDTKLGRVTCGAKSNPNCSQSKESIMSILNQNNVNLT